ncbi:hypothetical protein CXB51_033670 [Gossypium anomalum]|uniref:Reverse transcriptase Ty1/copia-type domain-containing protein n=1 Tax=Gossypium anomalum TaxID=47600 RepID=A0A8J5YAQ5_9ROSI|nr:hypothetical protein CXB51_033670 [Gossypium anomalum]
MVTRTKTNIFKPKALSIETVDYVPCTIDEAFASKEWLAVAQVEFDALINNSTWELVPLPYDRKVIGCKWLFKVKKNPDGTLAHRKDQLSDASLFFWATTDSTTYVLVYVDDIIVNGSTSVSVNAFIQQLHNNFSLKDIGDLHYFLGIEVTQTSIGCLHLCQRKNIQDLLARSSLTNAKSVHTPMISFSILSKDKRDHLSDPTEYRSLSGALQYVVMDRPAIIYTVNCVCQFMHAPTTVYWVALKRILRYLCGTIDYELVFHPSDRLSLVGYVDANQGLDFDDRRSTTGYYIYFGHPPISWCSKKQQVISRSTAEAEYQSLATATSHVANGSLIVGEVSACDQVRAKGQFWNLITIELKSFRCNAAPRHGAKATISDENCVGPVLGRPTETNFQRLGSVDRVYGGRVLKSFSADFYTKTLK